VCEAFTCLPSAAIAEIQHAPAGVLEDVLELRGYAAAKRDYDYACVHDPKAMRDDRMTRLVREIEAALVEEGWNAEALET
jgi:hypothetical protein